MTGLITLLQLVVGVMALTLATLALVESIRSARLATHRPFGLALSALGLSAGAHYLVYGLERPGPAAEAVKPLFAALLLALLPVAVFFWLRVEAYLDGPGDRFLDGKPAWIPLLPSAVAGVAGAVLVAAWSEPPATRLGWGDVAWRWLGVLPSILLVFTFLVVGWSLMRGQQTRHVLMGGWSLSGLAVALIFPTMAVAYATQVLTVQSTVATGLVDWVGVPAALWFWRECRRLTVTVERSTQRHTVTVPAQRAKRPAPWATDPR